MQDNQVDIWEAAEKAERDLAGLMTVVGYALDMLVPSYRGQAVEPESKKLAIRKLSEEYNKLKLNKETK